VLVNDNSFLSKLQPGLTSLSASNANCANESPAFLDCLSTRYNQLRFEPDWPPTARKAGVKLLALILETLGSTELLFILIIALVFFGPRKLPQISRSIGKSVAEFRRASEDFKRTWEREVALENSRAEENVSSFEDNSIMPEPEISPVPAEQVVAHETEHVDREERSEEPQNNPPSFDPLSKKEWL